MAATELIGRAVERAAIAQALEAAADGSARTIVVRGPAGIGKTALLDAVADDARDRFRVVRAAGHPAETELPGAGIDGLLRALDGPLPEEDDPLRMAIRLLESLAAAAESRPVLVLVDDVHWLDAPSRRALVFACRRLDADAVCLVLSVRPGDADEYVRELGTTLTLEPFTDEEAAALLSRVAPDASGQVIARIAEQSAGLPLALSEIPVELSTRQRRGADPLPEDLPLGESLEGLFAQRLAALAPRERIALLALSFDSVDEQERSTLLSAVGCDHGDLDAPERMGLIRLDANAQHFRHPVIPAAMRRAAYRAERDRVHRALADLHADDPLRYAFHLSRCTEASVTELRIAWAAAAEYAERHHAHADAGMYREHLAQTDDGAGRWQHLLLAADGYLRAGSAPKAERIIERLEEEARTDGARVAAAVRRAVLDLWLHSVMSEDIDRLRALCARVRAEGEAAERESAARLLEILTSAALASGRYREAHELGTDLRAGSSSLEQRLLADAAATMIAAPGAGAVLRSDWVDAFAWDRVHELGASMGFISVVLNWLGEHAQVRRILDRCLRVIDESGPTATGLSVLRTLAWYLPQSTGHWQRVVPEFATLERTLRDTDLDAPLPFFLLRYAQLRAIQGEEEECEAVRARARVNARVWMDGLEHLDRAVRATQSLMARDFEGALEHRARMREIEQSSGSVVSGFLSTLPDAVEAAWHLGRAHILDDELGEYEHAAEALDHAGMRGMARRCRAVSAQEQESADALFAEAVAILTHIGDEFETARTRLLWGQRLRRARRKSDAYEQLNLAEEVFTRLGCAPLCDVVRSELAACGARRAAVPETAPPVVATLTPREFEVAKEVSTGATNAEAARRLFISERTVEFHLSKVFRKLEISGRDDLASALEG
ncbi:hypothetical protein GCM10025768_15040 [Microbacterium pseudoresistens]|uniref:DNA-binding CsgD family transcriptional regulator n=1 Tax=Microbacterium pseudoresistens TaxID=640634 RepID=A0A7Y9ESH6_9MICO|nr:LuxR family transcriptional regulator [Microbacterium pseudoresistens]NYD53143.1 DNA-binding CsgD family transcriptional regulator [Microbacterium pseudoresistens]